MLYRTLDQVKTDLNLTQGEVTMFIPDMPNVPPQDVPVIIAQANQAQAVGATGTRAVGVCAPVSSNIASAVDNVIIPIGSAHDYFQLFEARTLTGPAITTIVQQPAHGVLHLITQADGNRFGEGQFVAANQLYVYLPDSNYVGKDSGTIQVDFGNGLKVNVKYYFQSISGGLADDWIGTYCSKTGPLWKINSTLDTNGTSAITSVEYQTPATRATEATSTNVAALASWINATDLSGNAAGVTVNVANLGGAAVGQDSGTNITLDATAAGNGWYINTNPADNADFLPTHNANVW